MCKAYDLWVFWVTILASKNVVWRLKKKFKHVVIVLRISWDVGYPSIFVMFNKTISKKKKTRRSWCKKANGISGKEKKKLT